MVNLPYGINNMNLKTKTAVDSQEFMAVLYFPKIFKSYVTK